MDKGHPCPRLVIMRHLVVWLLCHLLPCKEAQRDEVPRGLVSRNGNWDTELGRERKKETTKEKGEEQRAAGKMN